MSEIKGLLFVRLKLRYDNVKQLPPTDLVRSNQTTDQTENHDQKLVLHIETNGTNFGRSVGCPFFCLDLQFMLNGTFEFGMSGNFGGFTVYQ